MDANSAHLIIRYLDNYGPTEAKGGRVSTCKNKDERLLQGAWDQVQAIVKQSCECWTWTEWDLQHSKNGKLAQISRRWPVKQELHDAGDGADKTSWKQYGSWAGSKFKI